MTRRLWSDKREIVYHSLSIKFVTVKILLFSRVLSHMVPWMVAEAGTMAGSSIVQSQSFGPLVTEHQHVETPVFWTDKCQFLVMAQSKIPCFSE